MANLSNVQKLKDPLITRLIKNLFQIYAEQKFFMNRKIFLFIFFLIAAIITGCNSVNKYGMSVKAAGQTDNKEIPDPDVPIELEKAIDIALKNNPDIAVASWEYVAATADYDYSLGERFPKFKITGGYSHYLDEQRLIPARKNGEAGTFSRDILSTDFVATLPVFTGGKIRNQIEASNFLVKSAEYRIGRTREELIYNVSNTFFNILAQRKVIETLKFSAKVLEEHLKKIDALITAEKAANVDRLRTEVRIADIKQKIVQEENIMAILNRNLANLMGIDNSSRNLNIAGELVLDEMITSPDLINSLNEAYVNRRDFLAMVMQVEAQKRNLEATKAKRLPTIALQGSYGGRWAINETDKPADAESSEDVGKIGLIFELPVFEAGQIKAKIKEQSAKLEILNERLRKIRLQIRLDVETAILNTGFSIERIETIKKSIEQARESLNIEQKRYELGRGAIVDVLDAQAALLDAETAYYRALAGYRSALAQMKLAIGKEK